MRPTSKIGLDRRDFLIGTGAALGASALGGSVALAQGSTVTTLMVNAVMNSPLRETMESVAGVKIEDAPFQSTTDVVSKLLAPGGSSRFDLMVSGTEFSRIPVMGPSAGSEHCAALDMSKIPNASSISESFARDIVTRDGETYMLPLFWGYDSVLYNTEVADPEDPYTQSWAMIFDDKYAGQIAWYDTAHQMLLAAGLFLGMSEPEKMTKADLDEVAKFLISKKKNVRTFWTSFAQCSSLLGSGEIVATYGPIPVRVDLQKKGFPITNAWPKEGVVSFSQAGYIPKDAGNKDGALAVLNAFLSEEYASELVGASGYLTTSLLGTKGLTDEEKARLGYGILEGTTAAYPMVFPTDMGAWIEVWSRVKSA
ncbi:ABC transporter substrate-binding protein [Acuticoccus kandeliae]|uniref:ABC transporter substrate-binding protein n=1 Tax=Acuticoccus kandeliae TaxID=2073160 RepID=UPI000D3ED80D|nr:extracellular solute-binding protein [Acuticoccus kandeliae]